MGAAILYKKHLPITEVELPKQFKNLDALFVQMHIPNLTLHVSTLHNPPNQTLPVDLIKHLSKWIFLSDTNAHHPILKDNPSLSNREGRALADLFSNLTLSKCPFQALPDIHKATAKISPRPIKS